MLLLLIAFLVHSKTPLIWALLGPNQSVLIRECPHFRGLYYNTNYKFTIIYCTVINIVGLQNITVSQK